VANFWDAGARRVVVPGVTSAQLGRRDTDPRSTDSRRISTTRRAMLARPDAFGRDNDFGRTRDTREQLRRWLPGYQARGGQPTEDC